MRKLGGGKIIDSKKNRRGAYQAFRIRRKNCEDQQRHRKAESEASRNNRKIKVGVF